MTQWLDGPMTR